nr:teneurin-2 isoform X1 [Anolis sagrei ordinatus]XP_060620977.1 teneurin-2 isoform X1 [Anolis sagrei ordinatus]XP_060620978.1 teneurin-2 isoform X1 [Anolis sagrei ordinatus]XP_060620979.1 teneurin-2 isoform X1 [Anolis sagrei ordinatus]XP_060620981.1 teneurin-2 isoform X1 [Anolis sagrei ordinatus]XP_060620982.1 teneurin-2 isoform X1 [Anolis sagrei ordinatus]XP_060620983.1 teneurin-2 isoform X1 [Anolis sagrei ordinatus]
MDIKDRRHRSLTRGRCGKECRYTSSSLDSEDCRVPTQKSYSSSETLKAYDHDSRMHYGNRVTDLVHRESDEFPRQGTNFTLAELGICEPSPHRSGYCSDIGILHQGYSLSTGSDVDSDTEGGMSPEHAIRLWGRGIKSRRSSGLSSRENSALTLTDSDNDNKSDEENDFHTQLSETLKDRQTGWQQLAETKNSLIRRPIPPTSSSSLLPSAQLPSSHNPPPVSCQMPLLDSNTSHQIMDTNPDEEFSPNSYLLRACSGPQQTSSSGPSNHHSQSTLRPPLPPPHNHTLSHHHSSANSLNRNSLTNRRNQIHAPAPAPNDLATTPESVQLQDSWVLNSNVPLETRHFLFKTSSGTTPLFSSSSPGYPLTSGTVYTPPPRLLPRNTFSRNAFKLKKPSKYCSWKCAALSAIAAAILLAILLAYFIAMHMLGLNWQLQPADGHTFNNGIRTGLPGSDDVATMPSGGKGPWGTKNNSIDSGETEVGRRVTQEVPQGIFWRSQIHITQPQFLKFNISLGKDALFAVYIRRGFPPSHVQYDFMERLDGKEKWSVVESPRERRSIQTLVQNEAVFVQYLDVGLWHLAFYNDGKDKEVVSFSTVILDSVQDCPRNCHGNGECVSGVCHCFPGYHGADCAKAACPVLCSGNGQYTKGACLCYSGWKGPECDVPISQCIDPSCGGHGSCIEGNCVCSVGYKGENCEEVDCLDPSCSNHGVCVNGECLCSPGWGGLNCELPRTQCPDQCSGHGTYLSDTGLCNCDPNWMGPDCSVEVCSVDCGTHGVCIGGACRCEEGWTGVACDQRVCHPRCTEHGTCKDGKCECREGWNGEHCTIGRQTTATETDGCPDLCNGNGRCTLGQNSWQCVCQTGWRGPGCNVAMETSCADNKDNEGDGLVDCLDPDCCLQSTCQNSLLCRGSRDPLDIIQQSHSGAPIVKSFYDRIKLLVGKDSTHIIPGENPFNSSLVSLIRGQVVTTDGTPLVGVNVSFVKYPKYGYTITRQDGTFDLIANGGASLTLHFERAPFMSQERTVWLPWNSFYAMDTLAMKTEENSIPSCDLSGFIRPDPVIISSPLSTFFSASPSANPIVPETQVLHEEIEIPSANIKLCYLSSRTAGYKSLLKITMTQSLVPLNLIKVHLMVAVEGHLFQKSFQASPNLAYTFIWDKADAYGQKVYGLSDAVVSVGYEYETCPSLILWEKRTTLLQGFELDPSKLGGWSLDKHHVLNVKSGIIHKGNGENQFLTQQPAVITSIMGNGRRRSISCPSCNGLAEGNKLLAPVALAVGIDGSLFVGDFNYIRRIFPSRNVTSILELRNKEFKHSNNPAHKYYLAVDPVSGSLYVSDTNSRRIYRVRSLTGAKDLATNSEVVAGTGEQCLPFDEGRCGDGGKGVDATLMSPRGIAVDKYGLMYFVDATMIRKVDQNGIISTLLGSNDLTAVRPLSCDSSMDVSQVRLEWPTDLAVNPMDNSLYVLENNVILRITENHQVSIIAGRPMHCQVPGIDYSLSKLAIHSALESASAIAISHTGILYISETDEKKINRLRQVTTNGEICLLAGAASDCDCKNDVNCNCYAGDDAYATDAILNTPSSLAVAPDGTIYIADLGNIRIRAVSKNKPVLNAFNQYEIASPGEQELYVFNIDGIHQYTLSLVTGEYLYNFTYSADNDVTEVIDNNGNSLKVRRDTNGVPRHFLMPDNQIVTLAVGTNGGLKVVSTQTLELGLMTYHGNSGLLATKSDETGWTTFYDYDHEGRLTNVTRPTGVVTSLHREMEKSITIDIENSNRDDDVTVITNLSSVEASYTVVQDQVRNSYQLCNNGTLRVMYANGMSISFHSEPHVLAGTVTPTIGRCNISLPMENGLNSIEWRLRKEQIKGKVTVFGRKLRVHGRNLLSIDYDRNIRTEKIYDDHRKFTLRIIYDQLGRPFLWLPSSGLAAVNVSYFASGRLAGLQRGAMSEKTDIDKQGRIISRMFADGKVWSYTYLEKSMVLLLQSQRQYIFEYDSSDRLHAVTMPSIARHSMSTHTSIGYIRNIYNPPESNASVIFDYSDDGRILKTSFLGTGRQVFYKYGKLSKLSEIVYDSTAVTFGYDETTGVLKMVNLQSGGFSCTIRYRKIGPLVDKQIYRFSEEGMVNARFDYTYHDNSFRIASIKPIISEIPLPVDLYRYDEISGKVEHFGKFGVIYYDINQIITTAVMTLSKHFDTHGRIKEVQYEMFRSLMYWMTVQYDSMGRVTKRELKLGPYANTTKYTYDYDGDGQLQSVAVNDRPNWRYSYDLNGNLHLLNPGNSVRLMPLRYDLRDRITRLGDVQYKIDDDGFLCQRGSDIFEYNSKGLLTRAYNKANGWSIQYRYDGLGRRASYKTNLGHHLQYFYADLHNPTRITHVYNHSNSEITSLYYDLQGHLFAMESSSGEEYYVASDNTGTPLAVFSINGLMIKQLQYTAYGEIYHDTNPDFQIVIGFHGGLYDPLTKLVHFTQRDYDVLAGRWTSPDYTMWRNIGKEPAPFNLYMFKSNNPLSNELDLKNYVTDVKSWLVMFGFQLSNIIPGFPRAKMYFVPPPFELSESQACENGQLITGVQQATERHNQAFMALEGQVISKKLHANIREKAGHWFATMTPIIGKGIMFAVKEGRVTTGISSITTEDSRKIALVLNNAYYLEKMHYSIEGKDTHYFVKVGTSDGDLVTLAMTSGRKVLDSGINVTVSQPTLLVNGRTRRFTNIEFQYSTLLLNIRYGLTPDTLDEEKARVLDQARQRALGLAWAKEQQKARDGKEGSRLWTEGEKQQLLSTGRVQGYEGYYVLPVEQYPELADSSSNIQFLRQNEMGKR